MISVADKQLDNIMQVSSKDLSFETDIAKDVNVWQLGAKAQRSEDPYFYIESDVGERRPRIVSGKGNGVMLTTKEDQGYMVEQRAVWKIFKA